MKECENRYPWDAANDSVDGMRRAVDRFITVSVVTCLITAGLLCVVTYVNSTQYEEDYGLGSMVTTTIVYEGLTGDSFTGVVIRGETGDDPALTVRNRDGTERRIAIEFLEPTR